MGENICWDKRCISISSPGVPGPRLVCHALENCSATQRLALTNCIPQEGRCYNVKVGYPALTSPKHLGTCGSILAVTRCPKLSHKIVLDNGFPSDHMSNGQFGCKLCMLLFRLSRIQLYKGTPIGFKHRTITEHQNSIPEAQGPAVKSQVLGAFLGIS